MRPKEIVAVDSSRTPSTNKESQGSTGRDRPEAQLQTRNHKETNDASYGDGESQQGL